MAEDEVNARILLALQSAPRMDIPSGFAARVAGQLPALPVAVSRGRYGNRTALACLPALIALMLLCAPMAKGASLFWISLEWIFCLQLGVLAVWLAARKAGYTFASFF
jgi:hypothetical protein